MPSLLCAQAPTYLATFQQLMASFSDSQLEACSFDMEAAHRTKFSRLPGDRPGLKLVDFNEPQKIGFHRMLRSFFPSQGYLKITSIMFNEDIQKKNEPELGRNEYWFSVFGTPGDGQTWGWKLEGHHLSLNLSLKGNELLSFTPMTLASNPAVAHADGPRDGLAILYLEEELSRALMNSLSASQMSQGYSNREKPRVVYGESHADLNSIPKEGITVADLNAAQKGMLRQLVAEYLMNLPKSEAPDIQELMSETTRFFYVGSKTPGKSHYYRIENGDHFIEYENYDNHIHLLWRNSHDYGK